VNCHCRPGDPGAGVGGGAYCLGFSAYTAIHEGREEAPKNITGKARLEDTNTHYILFLHFNSLPSYTHQVSMSGLPAYKLNLSENNFR